MCFCALASTIQINAIAFHDVSMFDGVPEYKLVKLHICLMHAHSYIAHFVVKLTWERDGGTLNAINEYPHDPLVNSAITVVSVVSVGAVLADTCE